MRQVGGDLVEVTNLTPPGAEPHDLELTTDEVDAIQDADLVLYLGADFQPGVADAAGDRSGPLARHHRRRDPRRGRQAEDGADGTALDPHFWLDPTLHGDRGRGGRGRAGDGWPPPMRRRSRPTPPPTSPSCSALDAEMAAGLADCERTEIVTAHAAFHYLAERYGLEQLAITGLSPESEPDPARLDELADLIEHEGITTVFYETLVSPDVAETLAREAGVTTAVLNPIEGLTDDRSTTAPTTPRCNARTSPRCRPRSAAAR